MPNGALDIMGSQMVRYPGQAGPVRTRNIIAGDPESQRAAVEGFTPDDNEWYNHTGALLRAAVLHYTELEPETKYGPGEIQFHARTAYKDLLNMSSHRVPSAEAEKVLRATHPELMREINIRGDELIHQEALNPTGEKDIIPDRPEDYHAYRGKFEGEEKEKAQGGYTAEDNPSGFYQKTGARAMPGPITFEEAVDKTMRDHGLSHAQALAQIRQWYDEGEPRTRAIPDIEGKLTNAAAFGAANTFIDHAMEVMSSPLHTASSMMAAATDPGVMHRGAEIVSQATDPARMRQATESQVMQPPKAVGLAGDVAGLFGVGEATGLSPVTRALPGKGLISQAIKGAGEMFGLQKMGALGDMSPGEALSWGAAGPVLGKAAEYGLSKIFGRAAPEVASEATEAATEATTVPPAPEQVIPQGLGGIRAGQPYSSRTLTRNVTNVQGLHVFADQENELYGKGPPYPADWSKPLQINVPDAGEDGWRHAAMGLWADNPNLVESIQNAKDPIGYSMALVARKAKASGHDAVSLVTPDVKQNVILDLRDVKVAKDIRHPEITGETFRFAKKRPPTELGPESADDAYATHIAWARENERRVRIGQTPISEAEWRKQQSPFDSARPLSERVKAGEQANKPRPVIGWNDIDRSGTLHTPLAADKWPMATLVDGTHVKLNYLGPGDESQGYLTADGNILDSKVVKRIDWPADTLRGKRAAARTVHAMGDPKLADKVEKDITRQMIHMSGDPGLADHVSKMGTLTGNEGAYDPDVARGVSYIKRRAGWTRFIPVKYGSDDPRYDWAFQQTQGAVYRSNVFIREQLEKFKDYVKKYPKISDPKEFDEIARAVEGLEYVEGNNWSNLVQDGLNVSKEHDTIGRALARIRDDGYKELTNNDPRVPYILRRYGLSHNRWQLERLKQLQSKQGKALLDASRVPTKPEEEYASRAMSGMLNFDLTHDLDFEPFTGWLKFHPAENEKVQIEAFIRQYDTMKANYKGAPPFVDQVRLEEALERHKQLTEAMYKRDMARAPATDYLPRKKWLSILHGEGHPFYYSTDPNTVFGSWVMQIANKRVADVNLAHINPMLKATDLPGGVKDRLVEWGNAVRGATGYGADKRTAEQLNNMFHLADTKHEISAGDVHKWATTIQEWNRITKLQFSPIRFPIISATHLFPTAFPMSSLGSFSEGLAFTIANPKEAYQTALNEGIIGHSSEFAKDIGDMEGKLGKVSRPFGALSWITENFRKSAAYQIGLRDARKGSFNPAIRGFVNDINKYANKTQMEKAYARAFVSATQFELGKIDKPLAFQGGAIKRLVFQFKSWQANLLGLYSEMIRKKQWNSLAKGVLALGMLGGPTVLGVGGSYEYLRKELLRNGIINLPDRPGYHYLLRGLGMPDGPPLVDLQTLHDPFGVDPYNWPSMLGPTFGGLWDVYSNIKEDQDRGKTYKIPKDVLQGLSPQAQDAVEAAQEYIKGGVFGPGGIIDQNRPVLSIIARGLDTAPSVASQRSKIEGDLENAMISGNSQLVDEVFNDAAVRHITLGKDVGRRVRAFISAQRKASIQEWQP